ncbi:MAG: triple tyrosine motif-containing protein, partial [Rhodothermales bacterium]
MHVGAPRLMGQQRADWTEAGRLPLRYFDTTVFGASSATYSVTMDDRGLLYVGTQGGLLIHDGVNWELISIPGGNIVHRLAQGDDGTMYVGSYGQFGFMAADSAGMPAFYSLIDNVPPENRDFTYVKDVVPIGDSVYFLTLHYLFRWANDTMQVWRAEEAFQSMEAMGNRLVIMSRGGLWTLDEGEQLVPMALQGDALRDNFDLASDGPDHVLVVTMGSGLFRCAIDTESTSTCLRQPTDIDDLLLQGRPYTLKRLPDGDLAIGFDGRGLALLDSTYRIARLVDERDGLMNLEVMGIYPDSQGGLWLALYDGLARVEPRMTWTVFSRSEGLPSIITHVARWKGRLLATTMLGIYELVPGHGTVPARFEKISSEQFPFCMDLITTEAYALAACSGGLARIVAEPGKRASVSSVLDQDTYDRLLVDPVQPSVFYLTGEGTISQMRWNAGSAEVLHTEEISPLFFDIRADPEQPDSATTRLWATAHPDQLVRIDVPHDGSPWRVLRFDGETQFKARAEEIFFFNDTLRIATDAGLFRLQSPVADPPTFVLEDRIGARAVDFVGQTRDGATWIVVEDTTRLMRRDPEGGFALTVTGTTARSTTLPGAELYEDPDGALWLNHARGIARVVTAPSEGPPPAPSVLISKIRSSTVDSLLFDGTASRQAVLDIPYERGTLAFDYAAQVYDAPDKVRYRVWLEGFDAGWLKWTPETRKEYTGLSNGTYTFHVQARNQAGVVSDVASARITVRP